MLLMTDQQSPKWCPDCGFEYDAAAGKHRTDSPTTRDCERMYPKPRFSETHPPHGADVHRLVPVDDGVFCYRPGETCYRMTVTGGRDGGVEFDGTLYRSAVLAMEAADEHEPEQPQITDTVPAASGAVLSVYDELMRSVFGR